MFEPVQETANENLLKNAARYLISQPTVFEPYKSLIKYFMRTANLSP